MEGRSLKAGICNLIQITICGIVNRKDDVARHVTREHPRPTDVFYGGCYLQEVVPGKDDIENRRIVASTKANY